MTHDQYTGLNCTLKKNKGTRHKYKYNINHPSVPVIEGYHSMVDQVLKHKFLHITVETIKKTIENYTPWFSVYKDNWRLWFIVYNARRDIDVFE